ncbi:hypothetical protein [Laribacter hongkongensis]|uniref:hypothetical protein n=1 Tax=Laribacter hongkongensis TaxID=168471 RepID=UPI001EFD0467|nr:hypothetical protein [Laribacter hongkongensis]
MFFFGTYIICAIYIISYAIKIKNNPMKSFVFKKLELHKKIFTPCEPAGSFKNSLNFRQKTCLFLMMANYGIMIWGVGTQGWWMRELTMLYLYSALLVGVVFGMERRVFIKTFISGCSELIGVALVVGLSRSILLILQKGFVLDTILFWIESLVYDMPAIIYCVLVYVSEFVLCLLIPTTTGLAVLTMPILAPVADFIQLPREITVALFCMATGLAQIMTPVSGFFIGALIIGRVSFFEWVNFMLPLLVMLPLFNLLCLFFYYLL